MVTCVVIIQHMPSHFNGAFVEMLKDVTPMQVKLAEDGDVLVDDQILVVPSGVHLELVNNRRVVFTYGERVNNVRPSIDVAMKSVRQANNMDIMGVLLTGMGCDGVEGIEHIKSIGGTTIVQNKETSAVHNMPASAIDTGAVDFFLSPEEIADRLDELRVLVHQQEDVIEARYVGKRIAGDLGFRSVQQTQIATAISELVRNAIVHAGNGIMVLKPFREGSLDRVGLEITIKDEGPGINDIQLAMEDGFSNNGDGLGKGLSGTKRIMDEFDIKSEVGVGTEVCVKKLV